MIGPFALGFEVVDAFENFALVFDTVQRRIACLVGFEQARGVDLLQVLLDFLDQFLFGANEALLVDGQIGPVACL